MNARRLDSNESLRQPTAPAPKPRARRRRILAGVSRGHKLSLPDAVFERLELIAIRRRSTVSANAAEILDRNLPRLMMTQEHLARKIHTKF